MTAVGFKAKDLYNTCYISFAAGHTRQGRPWARSLPIAGQRRVRIDGELAGMHQGYSDSRNGSNHMLNACSIRQDSTRWYLTPWS
jgi:hypothetical protein